MVEKQQVSVFFIKRLMKKNADLILKKQS